MADFWSNLGNDIGNFFGIHNSPTNGQMGYDPSTNAPIMGGGSADLGTGAAAPAPTPSPIPAASNTPAGLAPTSSTGSDPNASPYLSSTTAGGNTSTGPDWNAMAANLMQPQDISPLMNAYQQMQIQQPDLLALSQQNYTAARNALLQNQDNVNHQYSQVGDNLNGLYTTDSNAARLGGNNILQHIANDQNTAVQGTANNAVQSLAALRNAELANRGGATGDWVSDPVAAATAGVVSNAQQAANNAQAQAVQNTNMNNEMADAMKTQGNTAIGQLENGRLSYNASIGNQLSQLANQEASREMQAQEQNYTNKLNLLSGMSNLMNTQYNDLTNRIGATAGNRGIPEFATASASDTTAAAKMLQTLQAATGQDPFQSAVARAGQYGPAIQQELSAAYQNGMGLPPGTKATFGDLYHWMSNNNSQNIPDNVLMQAAQDADASKALPSGLLDLSALNDAVNNLSAYQ